MQAPKKKKAGGPPELRKKGELAFDDQVRENRGGLYSRLGKRKGGGGENHLL